MVECSQASYVVLVCMSRNNTNYLCVPAILKPIDEFCRLAICPWCIDNPMSPAQWNRSGRFSHSNGEYAELSEIHLPVRR